MKKVIIFTDGACKGNPGPGGFAAILKYGDIERIIAGANPQTTNNQMELLAVIKALEALKKACKIDLFTDSQYVKNGITKWIDKWMRNGWLTSARKPVKNRALWKRLQKAAEQHEINWHWIRGHSGDELNERVDKLAVEAIKKLRRGEIKAEIFES